MNEGVPVMFHGSPMFAIEAGERRHLALEAPPRHWPRETSPRRDCTPKDTAFGYDSDDSSLSSNASGSNKSGEKGGPASPAWLTGAATGGAGPAAGGGGAAVGGGGGAARGWRAPAGGAGALRGRRSPHRRRIAPERYLNASYPFQVKFTPDELLNGSEWDTLSQEIWEKFVKSQQTEDTFRKKMNLWRYLYITIKAIFPRYGLYVVGSTMSGFALDASDMDLCLYVRSLDTVDPRAHALLHLNYILSYIRSYDPRLESQLIQAKVPILKLRDARNGLQVDLNCNNVVGIRNTNLLYCFSTMDWRVRPLVALLKLWARAHGINDARRCSLSSYSLTLMAIHYLQCGAAPGVLPRAAGAGAAAGWERARPVNRQTLAELFLAMLGYYAHFPYDKMAVSVRAGGRVPVADCRAARSAKNDPHQWKLLCVEEPFDLTNTARSVYDPETFEKIVHTFRESHRRLAAGRRLADAWPR